MRENRSFIYFREIFFYLIIIIFSLAFFKTISPFFMDILLAGVIVNFFKKVNIYFSRKLHKRQLASLLTVGLITLTLAIPLFITGLMISAEATSAYEFLKSSWDNYVSLLTDEKIKNFLAGIPMIGDKLAAMEYSDYAAKLASFGQSVLEVLLLILKKTLFSLTGFVVHFCIIIFLVYYLLLDSKTLLRKISDLLPLKQADEMRFFNEIVKIVDAILINTVLVGIGEGIFGGLLFAILGINSPFFWGLIMVILSMIPVVGATTILLPASIIQLITGNYFAGLVLLIIGVGGITINQNIIKPRLDGKRSGLHPAIVFLASMGGIIWLGMIGFLVGPLIAAMFIVTWKIVGEKFSDELKSNKAKPMHPPKYEIPEAQKTPFEQTETIQNELTGNNFEK